MKDQLLPVLLNLIASFAGALGQYFYKRGGIKLKTSSIFTNWEIAAGAFLFTLVMVLFVYSFKLGGRLSVTFPVYASTFIWGALLGIFIEGEPWSYLQGAGILLVIAGVMMIVLFSPAQ